MSKFGPKLAGAGGFINISQNAKKVVFTGTFTAGGLAIAIENGKVRITSEGKARKFVSEVEHKTFSGKVAVSRGQPVLYVTERCVFRLCEEGLELIEIAPGIDIERDILPFMDFKPVINKPVPLMDARIFRPEPMGLRNDMMRVPLESRFRYDPEENLFFINFENMEVKTKDDIEAIRTQVESILAPLGRKVSTVVNYDNFSVPLDLVRRLRAHGARRGDPFLQQRQPLQHERVHAHDAGDETEPPWSCRRRSFLARPKRWSRRSAPGRPRTAAPDRSIRLGRRAEGSLRPRFEGAAQSSR